MTILLILVNVGVFVFAQGGGLSEDNRSIEFTYEHAAIPCEILRGRPLTVPEIESNRCPDTPPPAPEAFPDKNVYLSIIESMFMHASLLHIGGNMLFLWIFGNNIEDKLRPLLYLVFYLLGGVVAALAQMALDPTSTVPLVGASGAVAAVMGAYLIWFPRAPVLALIFVFPLDVPAWLLLSFWFISQFGIPENSGVAWMAHVGGFVFGALVAFALRNTDWWRDRNRQVAYRF
jgi:membrane associated rhomboid family serine protease